jgi:Domain of unknown function (DUF4262)
MAPQRRPIAKSPADRKLLREIEKDGWTLMYITGNPASADFGFTIGLFASYQHPEIVAVGLNPDSTRWLLNRIAEQVRAGRHFDDVHEFQDVLQNQYGCRFRRLSPKLRHDYLGTAIWFYQGDDFPALQAFIPDVNGKYPWEEGVSDDASAQILAGDALRRRTPKT